MLILSNILLYLIPFYVEIFLCFLILLIIYHYIFNINIKLHNDNLSLLNIALLSSYTIIIIVYFIINDAFILFFSHKLFSIEFNNLLIKLFLLVQFCILCLL